MQIAVITGPTYEAALNRIRLANKARDGIELRLDLFYEFNLAAIQELLATNQGLSILTLRKRSHGGGFTGSEERRLYLISQLVSLQPDYLDLEFDTNIECLFSPPHTKIISSYHDFEKTPRDLQLILEKMRSPYAYVYKICTTARALSDSYKMLRFVQKSVKEGLRMIGLTMGDYGRITRRDGLQAGNFLNYTILHNTDLCAPGLQFA